jgi:far upstream element-binding protein
MENTIGSDNRNVFVEGSPEAVEQVKKMLEEIVSNQRKMKATQDKNNRVEVHVPNNMIGLVIGKGGDTIKGINGRTGAFVSISREPEH